MLERRFDFEGLRRERRSRTKNVDNPKGLSSRPVLDRYLSEIMPVFLYTRCFISFSPVRAANEGSSGIPSPRRIGTIATSTVSTNPAARRLRKREPPPEQPNILSALGAQSCQCLLGLVANDRNVEMFSLLQRARKNERLHAGHRSLSRFFMAAKVRRPISRYRTV